MSTQQSHLRREPGTLSDDESEHSEESQDGDSDDAGYITDDDPYDWNILNEDMASSVQGLSAEEMLGEDLEREASDIGASKIKFLLASSDQ